MNKTMLPTIASHCPAGTSTYTVLQYAQEIKHSELWKLFPDFYFFNEKNIADADVDADAHTQKDLLALTGGTMRRTLPTMKLQSRLFTTFVMSTQR